MTLDYIENVDFDEANNIDSTESIDDVQSKTNSLNEIDAVYEEVLQLMVTQTSATPPNKTH